MRAISTLTRLSISGVILACVAYGLRESVMTSKAEARRQARSVSTPAEQPLPSFRERSVPLEDILRHHLAQHPNDPKLNCQLAAVYLQSSDWTNAELRYRKVTQQWPRLAVGWQGLAVTLIHEGRYYEAVGAARRSTSLSPSSDVCKSVLAFSLMEMALEFPDQGTYKSQLAEARRDFEEILPASTHRGDILIRLGRICYAQNNNRSSIKYYTEAMQEQPDDPSIPATLIEVYLHIGDVTAARRLVESMLARFPNNASLHYARGEILQRSAETNAVAMTQNEFETAVKLNPNDADYQERFGAACLSLNNLTTARTAFELEIRLDGNRAYPYQQLALIYFRLGLPDRARQAGKYATDLVADDNQLSQMEGVSAAHPRDVSLQLALADRYRSLGWLGPARDKYLYVVDLAPHNARAEEALALLRKAQ